MRFCSSISFIEIISLFITQNAGTLKKKLLNLLLSTLLLLSFSKGFTQDIHFSQIGYSPLNLNPALTGVFEGDMRLTGNYRSQWNTVPVSYETFSAAYDMSFLNEKYDSRFFSAGLLINHDFAGDSRLTMTNIALSGSYTHRVATEHYLTGGVMGTFTNQNFDTGDLRFDRQYNQETRAFDPTLNAAESDFFGNNSTNIGDVSAGVNWHYRAAERSRRTSFDVGIAAMHFNQPEKSFLDDEAETLPLRWSIYGFGNFYLAEKIDLLLHGTYQDQGPHQQLMYGAGLQVHLDTDFDEELALQVALNRRSEDALSLMLGLRYRMWKGAFSYDLNTSEFNNATNNRAGPEFSLIYIITRVKPMVTKICPVYL